MSVLQATMPCNLCEGQEVTVLSNRSRSGNPMRSVACTGCGLVWADPRPHEVRKFYEEDYRLAYKGTFRPRAKHVLRAGRIALERLERIRTVLKPGSRVLDVGSGGGEFAYLLQGLGHQVTGVEPNRGYAGFSREQYGLDVRVGFIGEVELPAEGFDVITIWHVLEHTEDPAAVLRKLRAALRPGGRLVVEVPNVEATCQSPRSSFHEAHLYTFSPKTLDRLGAKTGLEQVQSTLTPDGGNLTMVFTPSESTVAAAALQLPGHHARVADIVKQHTPWSHAMSRHPWQRAAARCTRMLSEFRSVRHGTEGKALLDSLYAERTGSVPAQPTRPKMAWGWLLAAYALAVAAEEILLDGHWDAVQLNTAEGLVAYLGLQVLVLGALFWAFGRKLDSPRGLLKASAWALPLLGVPAVC